MNYLYFYREPLYIFPVLANILIINPYRRNKNKRLKQFALTVIIFFTSYNIFSNFYFVDLWASLIISLMFYFKIITKKEKNYRSHLALNNTFTNNNISEWELGPFDKQIFKRHFECIFTENDFKKLFEIAERKVNKGKRILVKEGDNFDRVFFFAQIPARKSVIIRNKHVDISYLEEGSWIGMIEFILYQSNDDINEWLIDLHLHFGEEEVVYYQWDLVSLHNLLNHSTDLEFPIKLLLIWIRYLCSSIMRLDDHISNALKALIDRDKAARAVSMPIYRYLSGRRKSSASFPTEEIQPEPQIL